MHAWPTALLLVALLPVLMQFRRARPRPVRQGNRFRHFAVGALWLFGAPVPVLLMLADRLPALATMPPEFQSVADSLGVGDHDRLLVLGMIAGALLGSIAATGVTAWQAWRGKAPRYWFGEFASLEATDPADRRWAAVLSLVAGVTEEAYFRLLLPLLAALAWPDGGTGVAAGFVGSALLFGAAHRYQGWRGMVMTTIVAVGMTGLYLASGSLVLAMAYHALIDVGSLVVRPWVRAMVARRPAQSFADRPELDGRPPG